MALFRQPARLRAHARLQVGTLGGIKSECLGGFIGIGILSQAIIFILGWPLEWTEIIIFFVPIFLPLLKHYNIDPILWGCLVCS